MVNSSLVNFTIGPNSHVDAKFRRFFNGSQRIRAKMPVRAKISKKAVISKMGILSLFFGSKRILEWIVDCEKMNKRYMRKMCQFLSLNRLGERDKN